MYRVILSCIVLISQCLYGVHSDKVIKKINNQTVNDINNVSSLSAKNSNISNIYKISGECYLNNCHGGTWKNISGPVDISNSSCNSLEVDHSYSGGTVNVKDCNIPNIYIMKNFSSQVASYVNIWSSYPDRADTISGPKKINVVFQNIQDPCGNAPVHNDIRNKNVITTNDPHTIHYSNNCIYNIVMSAGIGKVMIPREKYYDKQHIGNVSGSGNIEICNGSIINSINMSFATIALERVKQMPRGSITAGDETQLIVGDSDIKDIETAEELTCMGSTGNEFKGITGNADLRNTDLTLLKIDNQQTKMSQQNIELVNCDIQKIQVNRGNNPLHLSIFDPKKLPHIIFNGGDAKSNSVETNNKNITVENGCIDYLDF